MLNELLERIVKDAGFKVFGDKIVAADDNTSGLATESVKRLVEIVRADEREAAMAAILETMTPETQLILRRAWDRVRTMRSNKD